MIALLLVAACSSDSEPRQPALLWVSEAGGTPHVAGADLRLPDGATFPAAPDPRGTHVLLVATTDGASGHTESLWLVPLEGDGGATELHTSTRVRNPAWFPGGSAVVFESDARSYRDLYRIDRDGSGLTRLTDASGGSFEPAISPDGALLAMGSSRTGGADIHVLDLRTGETTRVTEHRADDVQPAWTADGQLAFRSLRDGAPRVFTTSLRGGEDPRPLDGAPTGVIDHRWSPVDGAVALTVAEPDGTTSLHVRDADGTIHVIDGPGPDEHPAWSPDGSQLAFTSSRTGHPEIWVTDLGGAEQRQVSDDGTAAWLPRWR